MSLKSINIEHSYNTGEDIIVDNFINPALSVSVHYKRSVGFFSSSVFPLIANGLSELIRNGGDIKLIASPKLSDGDIEAIKLGYEKKESIINNVFSRDFNEEIQKLDDESIQMLFDLIAEEILEIQIAVTKNNGIYHDKLGILEDEYGNTIAFCGSSNETFSGYKSNYEKVRVFRGWIPGEDSFVEDEVKEFDSLWNGNNDFVTVYNYSDAAKRNLFEVIEHRKNNASEKESQPVQLRPYQKEAIESWINNNYHGFYVMATGTGKTWTALFSAKALFEKHPGLLVVCAPYKHLIKQWAEDIEKLFVGAKIIMVSSENPKWEQEIREAIIGKEFGENYQIIITSTIMSFESERFEKALSLSKEDKLLIVDEAHRFTKRPDTLKTSYKYMLGLSATPYSGSSAKSGKELMDFFDGQVFNLPIEDALGKFLVEYNYYPIFVNATAYDEEKFNKQTSKMISCTKNGVIVDREGFSIAYRGRLRTIAMAEEKISKLDWILSQIQEKDHVVVYCGDGRLFSDSADGEKRHISIVKEALTKLGFKSSQFTATEKMDERMQLVDSFNKQNITALAAIRCLDEGINIPSIKSALILASNDDYREFVQRRGRILRQYKDKQFANIYDVVVLPSYDLTGMAKIELRRFYEYARLSLNWESELKDNLDQLLTSYGLEISDIDVYDYDNMEENLDE